MLRFAFSLLLLLSSCAPQSAEYRHLYRHVRDKSSQCHCLRPAPPYLVVLTDARRLDYTDACSFFRTMTKHPSDGSKNSDVGHVWIYLAGQGRVCELGHSGELGTHAPGYFEGVMQKICGGEPDPISYLWSDLHDGFCQLGPGGHRPTFAALFPLSEESCASLFSFIGEYDFKRYSLTEQQCATFAVEMLERIGITIDPWISVDIPSDLSGLPLRESSCYSKITFASPDMVEKELIRLVKQGVALDARGWYKRARRYRKSPSEVWNSILLFPDRWQRHCAFY